jgi:hypothetical protein
MHPIDAVFALWQRDERGQVIWNHCERAYLKEADRRNLPPEYREQPVAA